MSIEAAELLRRVIRCAGIDATYGRPCASLGVAVVPDDLAFTFAVAHQHVFGTRAAVHLGDGAFKFVDAVGSPLTLEVSTPADLVDALPHLARNRAVELRILFELDALVNDVIPHSPVVHETWIEPAIEVVEAVRSAGSVTVLAGPGVVRESAVPAIHDLAVKGNLGVLNTWGAKGIFDWRSRHHLATVGLQEHDFVLGGLGEVALIISTGLDPLESPQSRWQLAPSVDVPPHMLGPLAEQCPSRAGEIEIPPLRSRLAAVTQRGWARERGPLPPTRVTMHYAACLAQGALVAADAGVAGFWVARTLGTTRLGGVIVPSSPIPGFAAACVAVSQLRQPNRPALAVVDRSDEAQITAVVDAARSWGIDIPMEEWNSEGTRLNAEDHRVRLQRLMSGDASIIGPSQSLATDQGQLAEMVDAAGPVVAWT
jgi:hypothetical protein